MLSYQDGRLPWMVSRDQCYLFWLSKLRASLGADGLDKFYKIAHSENKIIACSENEAGLGVFVISIQRTCYMPEFLMYNKDKIEA